MYSKEFRTAAIKMAQGRTVSIKSVAKQLGINRDTLHRWIAESPEGIRPRPSNGTPRRSQHTHDEKFKSAAIKLAQERTEPMDDVAAKVGVTRKTLYKWIAESPENLAHKHIYRKEIEPTANRVRRTLGNTCRTLYKRIARSIEDLVYNP